MEVRDFSSDRNNTILFPQFRVQPDYLPGGKRALSGIAEHAVVLGIVLGIACFGSVQLLLLNHYLWRLPSFIAVLALFHFLEFDMTARYNTPDAKVSSFLLFNNGAAYNIAHSAAMCEILLRYWLVKRGTFDGMMLASISTGEDLMSFSPAFLPILGLVLIVVGQTFRSLAMRQAGTSFNHIVQSVRKEDHKLITTGVYAFSRHPAYFGFYWWAIGTQLLLGNVLCLVAYAIVLWKFFGHRVQHEEKHLLSFFGKAYETYREQVSVWLPFID